VGTTDKLIAIENTGISEYDFTNDMKPEEAQQIRSIWENELVQKHFEDWTREFDIADSAP
jgi:hypothetical protein